MGITIGMDFGLNREPSYRSFEVIRDHTGEKLYEFKVYANPIGNPSIFPILKETWLDRITKFGSLDINARLESVVVQDYRHTFEEAAREAYRCAAAQAMSQAEKETSGVLDQVAELLNISDSIFRINPQ